MCSSPPSSPVLSRGLVAACALLAMAGGAGAAEWRALLDNSPFGGQTADAAPAETPGQLEFRGVVEEDGIFLVNLYNPSTKTAQWIPVDGQVPGLTVNAFDRQTNKVVITQGARQFSLPLQQPKVTLMAAVAPPAPVPGNPGGDGQAAGAAGGPVPQPGAGGPGGGPAREFMRNLPPEAQAMVEEMRRRRAERLEAMGAARGQNAGNRAGTRPR